MSEARDIILELRAGGVKQTDIAAALKRSTRMVRKVEAGQTPGDLYLPALRDLKAGRTVTAPARTQQVYRVKTKAGPLVQATRAGLSGVYSTIKQTGQGANNYMRLTITYTDRKGRERRGTLYARGGRKASEIDRALQRLGAVPGDRAAIERALRALVYEARFDDDHGGASQLADVTKIVAVSAGPA